MKFLTLAVVLAAVFATGCEDPAANKPKATTSAPSTNSAPANSSAPPANTASLASKGEAVQLTPENSKIEFTGSKVTGKHDGGFNQFTGIIDLVNSKAEESTVAVDIEMASVYSDADGLTDHLKTGDFFEVAKYPKSTFVSTKIVPDGEKGAGSYTITGDLEMRGVKKSVTFPATITINDDAVAVKTEFAINRKDFGIVYTGKADDLIRDEVVIKLDLKSARNK